MFGVLCSTLSLCSPVNAYNRRWGQQLLADIQVPDVITNSISLLKDRDTGVVKYNSTYLIYYTVLTVIHTHVHTHAPIHTHTEYRNL